MYSGYINIYSKEAGKIMYGTQTEHMNMRRHVLVVDDEFVNRQLLGYILSRDYEVMQAENGRVALELIQANLGMLSAVLLDLHMPEVDGYTVLKTIQGDESLKRIPVIVLTSDKSAEVESLKLGAVDFIPKPYDMPDVILARVQRTIDLSEGEFIIRTMERDELTGLYTEQFFYEYARQIDKYHPDTEMDAVVFDINHFKLVNELYGRDFGDQVLQNIAGGIMDFINGTIGIACHYEQDRFFLYCEHREDYEEVREMIRSHVPELSKNDWSKLRAGIYSPTDKSVDISIRFSRAALACDEVRNDYGRFVGYFDERLLENTLFRERVIQGIPAAIENGQMIAYFQPRYDIRGEKPVIKGAEASLHWQHPELGLIRTGRFLPLVERSKLIQDLDLCLWKQAAAISASWQREKARITLPITVTVSRVHIYDPEFQKRLMDILRENRLAPQDFILKISASAYAEDTFQIVEVIRRLQDLGFRIEISDFDLGHLSLNMLSMLPLQLMRFNLEAFPAAYSDDNLGRLCKIMHSVADYLSVPVAAEGVDRKNQEDILKKNGASLLQGSLYSKPVLPEQFRQLLKIF